MYMRAMRALRVLVPTERTALVCRNSEHITYTASRVSHMPFLPPVPGSPFGRAVGLGTLVSQSANSVTIPVYLSDCIYLSSFHVQVYFVITRQSRSAAMKTRCLWHE